MLPFITILQFSELCRNNPYFCPSREKAQKHPYMDRYNTKRLAANHNRRTTHQNHINRSNAASRVTRTSGRHSPDEHCRTTLCNRPPYMRLWPVGHGTDVHISDARRDHSTNENRWPASYNTTPMRTRIIHSSSEHNNYLLS